MREHLRAGIDEFCQLAREDMVGLSAHLAQSMQAKEHVAIESSKGRFYNLRKRVWLTAVPLVIAFAAACSKDSNGEFEFKGFEDGNGQGNNARVGQFEEDDKNNAEITILDPRDEDLPARIGDTLKDFEFEGIDGRLVSYHKSDGKPLIILMCCYRQNIELGAMAQIQSKYAQEGLKTIVILRDRPYTEYLPTYNLRDVINDTPNSQGNPFKFDNILSPRGLPSFFGVDRNGIVIGEIYDPNVLDDLANLLISGKQVEPFNDQLIDKSLTGYGFDQVYEDLSKVASVFSLIHHAEYNTFDRTKFEEAFEEYKVGVELAKNSGSVLTPTALDYFLEAVDLIVSGYCDNQENPDSALIEQTLIAFSSYIAIQYEKMADLGRVEATDWPQVAARFTPACEPSN